VDWDEEEEDVIRPTKRTRLSSNYQKIVISDDDEDEDSFLRRTPGGCIEPRPIVNKQTPPPQANYAQLLGTNSIKKEISSKTLGYPQSNPLHMFKANASKLLDDAGTELGDEASQDRDQIQVRGGPSTSHGRPAGSSLARSVGLDARAVPSRPSPRKLPPSSPSSGSPSSRGSLSHGLSSATRSASGTTAAAEDTSSGAASSVQKRLFKCMDEICGLVESVSMRELLLLRSIDTSRLQQLIALRYVYLSFIYLFMYSIIHFAYRLSLTWS